MHLEKKLKKNIAWSLVARAFTVVNGIITTPILLSHFGAHEFGMWVVLTSLPSLIQIGDMGFSNAIVNQTAGKLDEKATQEAASSICTAYAVLILLALIITVTGVAASLFLPKNIRIIQDLYQANANIALPTVIIFSALNIPLSLVQRLQQAAMDIPSQAKAQLSQLFATLCLTIMASPCHMKLTSFMLAYCAMNLLIQTINTLIYIPKLIPNKYSRISISSFKKLWVHAKYFALFQAIFLLTTQTDVMIIQNILSSTHATAYYATLRILSIPGMIVTIINNTMWPAYTSAFNSGKINKIKTWVDRGVIIAIILHTITLLFIILFSNIIQKYFLVGKIDIPNILAISCFIWVTTESISSVQSTAINATKFIYKQTIISIGYGICLPLKALFVYLLGIQNIFIVPTVYYIGIVIPFQRKILNTMTTNS